MKTVTVGKNDAGQRLDKFLTKSFRLLPVSMMYKYIRQKDIKCNGKRCTAAQRLTEGDVLTLYVKDEFLEPSAVPYDFLRACFHTMPDFARKGNAFPAFIAISHEKKSCGG